MNSNNLSDKQFYTKLEAMDNFFLIVGFPKAATSTVANIINTHPDAYLSERKEPYFFPSNEYYMGMDYYWNKYFYEYNQQKVVGEAQVTNSFFPYVPERIHKKIPNAKIIFCLRDPIERAFSAWWMSKAAQEKLSFREVIEWELYEINKGLLPLDDECFWDVYSKRWLTGDQYIRKNMIRTYLTQGYYAHHIKRYQNYYSKDNMFFLLQEDLRNNKKKTLQDLFAFLGLDIKKMNWENCNNKNVSKNSRFLNSMKKKVKNKWGSILPGSIYSFGKKSLKYFDSFISKPDIPPDLKSKMIDFYTDKNVELESIIDRDLSLWNL